MLIVSRHAARRMHQRLGLNRRSIDRHVRAVNQHGLRRGELSGEVRRWMDELRYSGKVANWAIIYLDYAYLMRGLTIVTVVPVPVRFRARLRRLMAKRKEISSCDA